MNQPYRPDAPRSAIASHEVAQRNPGARVPASSYRSMLEEPAVSLAGSAFDRPDVAAVAILGYN
jgi:hypothetical protein